MTEKLCAGMAKLGVKPKLMSKSPVEPARLWAGASAQL